MNNQKIKLIIEASKGGKKKLEESITKYFDNIRIINDSNERIEFIYDLKKYRIAYGKEGLKKNFIEYQNYKRLAYKYDSNHKAVISTVNKAYLENLEILGTIVNSEKNLIEVKENIVIKELDDIRIIATKEGYHQDLKIILKSENDYFKLKRAINKLQNNSIIGKIKKESLNYYSNTILFNEFSELFFTDKTLKTEIHSILHFDLEDFLLNGEELNWESKYTKSYFGSQSISIQNIKEYFNCKAILENDFENLYRDKNLEENLYNNYQQKENSINNCAQNYYNEFLENSDGFGINWCQSLD